MISSVIKSNNITELYKNLNEEEKKAKKEQKVQNDISRFWKKNEKLLNTPEEPENKTLNDESSNKNNNKKSKFLTEGIKNKMQKQQNLNSAEMLK